jgi:hypothetical protein
MTFDLDRRAILAGLLVSIAAPAIIRTPGLLMPVRDRTVLSAKDLEWATIFGTRDYEKYPATLAEVKAWRQDVTDRINRGIFVNPSVIGFNRMIVMVEAEERYQAMGLL